MDDAGKSDTDASGADDGAAAESPPRARPTRPSPAAPRPAGGARRGGRRAPAAAAPAPRARARTVPTSALPRWGPKGSDELRTNCVINFVERFTANPQRLVGLDLFKTVPRFCEVGKATAGTQKWLENRWHFISKSVGDSAFVTSMERLAAGQPGGSRPFVGSNTKHPGI